MLIQADMGGGGGVKNDPEMAEFINEQPLIVLNPKGPTL
jgi:hypothetical protein